MVAKGFLAAAAAIIICCGTTLRGNDPDGTCAGGDCPAASSANQPCSAEGKRCAEGKCDDKEECCEQEQVAVEKCSTEKCATSKCSTEKCNAEQCSTEKCSTAKCSTGECAKSKCSAETCAMETCSTEKCSADKCTAGKCGGEKCAFTTTLGGLCGPLKCALEATPVSIGVTVETCSKSACSAESCATEQGAASMKANVACNAGACEGESCPVAVCATQVCEALKCAVQSCTTASDDDSCQDEICVAGTCGTTQCATLQCSGQDCPAGQCNGAPFKVAGRSGQKCGVSACLTATGGEFTFTMAEWFPGTPVVEKCSQEVCTEGTCSTAKCGAEKCSKEVCTEGTCVAETCSTSACKSGECAKSACASRTAAVVERPALEVAKATCNASTACSAAKLAVGCSKLETKLAELKRLQQEIAVLRSPAPNAEMYIVDVKVVEVNRTKCRSLGFDFETADMFEQKEFTTELCEGLVQKNLAKVLFNPTLCVTSDHPASFAAGVEVPNENGDGKVVSEFVGRKLDVVASSLGEDKVRLEIAPTISEVSSSNEGGLQTKVLKWDCALEATLGKTVVMKGGTEVRICSILVEGRGVVQEPEQIQTMLLVTVDRANNLDPRAAVRQATYEKTLVEAVKEPEFVTKVYPVPDLQVWKVRPQGVEFDADLLVAHLKSTVDPQSWRGAVCSSPADAENANGAIQPFERNGSLVICQTVENHQQIAKLLQKMRAEGQQKDAAREERELRDGGVTPASAEEPVEQESKCDQGECSESKCSESKCQGAKCSKSEVSLESEGTDECPGDCQGKCDGDCPEAASCPCIGGTCTR